MMSANNLTPWNGITPNGKKCPYYQNDLFTDSDSNIYYIDSDGNYCVWCSAKRLEMHVHRLQQISARK